MSAKSIVLSMWNKGATLDEMNKALREAGYRFRSPRYPYTIVQRAREYNRNVKQRYVNSGYNRKEEW